MNVIGIVQTDLNEFDILFEKTEGGQGSQGSKDSSGQTDGNDQSGFLGLFGGSGSGGGGNQQDNLQEMTVRIKGVPEGQKATFLQMYQIIQDAKEMRDLEQNLTIVSRGGDDNQQGGNPQQKQQ